MYLSTDKSILCTLLTWLDVYFSCCHTSLFVTYALRGVTSQQQNRLWRSHTIVCDLLMLRDHTQSPRRCQLPKLVLSWSIP